MFAPSRENVSAAKAKISKRQAAAGCKYTVNTVTRKVKVRAV